MISKPLIIERNCGMRSGMDVGVPRRLLLMHVPSRLSIESREVSDSERAFSKISRRLAMDRFEGGIMALPTIVCTYSCACEKWNLGTKHPNERTAVELRACAAALARLGIALRPNILLI